MDVRAAERGYDGPGTEDVTIPELFAATVDRHADRPAQQYKGGVYDRSLTETVLRPAPDGEFRALTYGDLDAVVRHLAAGLRELGVEAGTHVALYSHTRMEWAQVDLAVLAARGVVTTVYPSASEDTLRYLLSDAEASGVVLEDGDLLERLLAVEDDLDLEFVVLVDRPTGDAAEIHRERDDVYTLAEVHDRGAECYRPADYDDWIAGHDPGELASLIYTSGTTGRPKGVRLTHRNFRENVRQVLARFGERPDGGQTQTIDEHTRSLSFLPLAHVFERLAGHFVMLAEGACVAYAEDPETLREDFRLVRPTTTTSVPRVYERLYDAVREQAAASERRERIFEWATGVGRSYHATDSPGLALRAKRAAADLLVFRKVRTAMGGEVEFMISGGGSLSPELCSLFHGMGIPVLEGYGLTETSPVVAANPPEAPKVGTIGPPVIDQGVYVDESVVPESGFDGDGAVGELLVRGPNVTDGYWNRPDATDAAFTTDVPAGAGHGTAGGAPDGGVAATADAAGAGTADGVDDGTADATADAVDADEPWFRTGDIVHRRPDGYLSFRERAKQLLVLSTGKNVAPGPIEGAFATSEVIEYCMVLGDGRKFVAALLVPDLEHVRSWASDEGVSLPEDAAAVCEHDAVRAYVQREVDRVNDALDDHETIKRFALLPESFEEPGDLLTPTMKKKRSAIAGRYEERIETLYEDA